MKTKLTKADLIKIEKISKEKSETKAVTSFDDCCDCFKAGVNILTYAGKSLVTTHKGKKENDKGEHTYYVATCDGVEIVGDSHTLFTTAFGFEKTPRRESSSEGGSRKKAITEEDFCKAVRKSLLSLCSVGNRNAYDYHNIIMEQTALAVAEYVASEQAEADRIAGHNARISNAKKRQNEILSELAQATPETLPALQAELLQLATFIATAV